MTKLWLLAGLMMAGCGHAKVVVPVSETKTVEVQESKLTDEQKIALLRVEAHKRGLRWAVVRVDQDEFLGFAVPKETILFSDSSRGRWFSEHKASQADAAYSLYLKIQGPPHDKPETIQELSGE